MNLKNNFYNIQDKVLSFYTDLPFNIYDNINIGALKVKEKLWRRRERLFKMLVATREGQYKRDAAVGNSVNNDLSSVHAQLLEKLAKLENKPED